MKKQPDPISDVVDARILAMFGDKITTDHISPAGSIKLMPDAPVSLAPRNDGVLWQSQKEKDQLSLAQYRDCSPANRPDPDGPGGLGAEESGTERTGSTQDCFSQARGAGGGRKWGSNMILLTFP